MALVWNPFGLPGLLTPLVAWPAAWIIYSKGPTRPANRRLALVLAIEGATWGTGAGLLYMQDSAVDGFAIQAVFITGVIALPFLYLSFLATLDTPLVHWLRSRVVQLVGLALLLAAEIYWLTHPFEFTPAMVEPPYAPVEAVVGPLTVLAINATGVAGLFGIAVAVSAYRRAGVGTPARDRAKHVLLAFGLHDAVLAFITVGLVTGLFPPPPSGTGWDYFVVWGTAVNTFLFVALIAYGGLKSQLFDIDLRIKKGLGRGALAAVFLLVFFVVSQLVQVFAPAQFGVIGGAIASGLLLFALQPLQGLASRFANTAMPGVQPTGEYIAFRKLQVYRAALEGAVEDGVITGKERTMLERLRAELAIAPDDAALLERDVLGVGTTTA